MGGSEDIATRRKQLDLVFQHIMSDRRQGVLQDPVGLLRRLFEDYGDIGAVDRQAMVAINLAQVLQRQGDFDKAETEYLVAKRLARSIGDERRMGISLGGLATLLNERGRLDEAESLLNQALEVFRALDDDVGIGNQLGNLGLLHQGQGRLEEAVRYFQEAAKHFAAAGNLQGAIGVLQAIGELHRRQGEFDDAESAHYQALELAERSNNLVAQAHSSRALGQVLRVRGDLKGARHWIEKGMELHRRAGDLHGELQALIDLGTVNFATGRTGEAIANLDECYERAQAAGSPQPVVKALLNRALYRLDTVSISEVEADLKEAEPLLDRLGDPMAWNVWSVTQARVLIRQARWEEAESLLRRELQRSEANNLVAARPAIMGLLGSVHVQRGEVPQAAELFNKSEDLYRALGDVEGARMAVLARARLQLELGQLDSSRIALNALLSAVEAGDLAQPVLRGEILAARSSYHDLSHAFEASLADAQRAAEIFAEVGFQASELGARLACRNTQANRHRFEQTPLPDDYIDALEALVALADRLEAPTIQVVTRASLADARLLAGHSAEEAREPAQWALETARRVTFPDGEARCLEVLARIDDNRTCAIAACRKWRAVHSPLRADRVVREWHLEEEELAAPQDEPAGSPSEGDPLIDP